jgi:hypothetical protein
VLTAAGRGPSTASRPASRSSGVPAPAVWVPVCVRAAWGRICAARGPVCGSQARALVRHVEGGTGGGRIGSQARALVCRADGGSSGGRIDEGSPRIEGGGPRIGYCSEHKRGIDERRRESACARARSRSTGGCGSIGEREEGGERGR